MIELESFSVFGMRSLADVPDIPVREPTIITGANDGGKSTALYALAYEQWAHTANEHWPRDDGGEWTADHFASLRQADKFSKAIENEVRGCSSNAPPRKTGYLVALVQGLAQVEEVPAELVTIFRSLASVEPN